MLQTDAARLDVCTIYASQKLRLQTWLLAKLEPDYSRVRPLHAYRRLEGGRTRSCREEFRRIDLLGLPIGGCP